mgnify:CR=1 FL=1
MANTAYRTALGALQKLRLAPGQQVRKLHAAQALAGIKVRQAAALGKHIFDITDSELDIGWLGLAEFMPAVLLVLITGTIADRLNRKKISLVAQFGEFVSSILLMFYALTNPTSAGPMFAIAVLFGASRAFLSPALRPIAAMIAPSGGLPRVIAFYSATWTGAAILGPAVSGFLYAVDPALAYGVSAALISGGMFFLSLVKLPPVSEPVVPLERPTLRDAVEGLVFIRKTPVLLAAISLDLFAVLFGLSMDYEVFIVSRMREARDKSESTVDAIKEGLAHTGGVVTAAAVILVGALGGLANGHIAGLQELGVGLALGILIDATIVRTLLLPSVMTILGKWNWWLPAGIAKAAMTKASPLED